MKKKMYHVIEWTNENQYEESFTTYQEALNSAHYTFNRLTTDEKKRIAIYIIKAPIIDGFIDYDNAIDKKTLLDFPDRR